VVLLFIPVVHVNHGLQLLSCVATLLKVSYSNKLRSILWQGLKWVFITGLWRRAQLRRREDW